MNNPPAFPSRSDTKGRSFAVDELDTGSGMPVTVVTHPGMSLRDWFAGLALQGMLASLNRPDLLEEFNQTADKVEVSNCQLHAMMAYNIADAMLAEREKAKP